MQPYTGQVPSLRSSGEVGNSAAICTDKAKKWQDSQSGRALTESGAQRRSPLEEGGLVVDVQNGVPGVHDII